MMDARRNGLVLLALLLLTQTTISAQTDSMGKDVPIDRSEERRVGKECKVQC